MKKIKRKEKRKFSESQKTLEEKKREKESRLIFKKKEKIAL